MFDLDDSFDEQALFHQGLDLFNRQSWFDAHETWEEIWVMASGPTKRFYQGLIQCAVVMEHVRRGNPRGVRAVWKTARQKFEGLDPVYQGVDLRQLMQDIARVIDPILNLPEDRFDPALPRGQDLPYDPANAPKIKLQSVSDS